MVAIKGKGWRLAPSLLHLIQQLDKAYPGRDRRSDGSIGDQAHASRASDHNPHDGFVHAVDIDEDIADGVDLKGFAERLRKSRDPRIRYVIYEGRVFKSYAKDGVAAWTWQRYTGPNAHATHLHVSIDRTAKARDDMRAWPVTATIEDDDMSQAAEEAIARIERDILSIRAETDKFYDGTTITKIADAVVAALPAPSGGKAPTAAEVAKATVDLLADRAKA